MNNSSLEQIINAVLYEGYILYPYRASSPKNQRERFTFGRVYPTDYSATQGGVEPSMMQAQVLVKTADRTNGSLNVCVRFLHPMRREVGVLKSPVTNWPADKEPPFNVVPQVEVNGRLFQSWHEAVEREIMVPAVGLDSEGPQRKVTEFAFPYSRIIEPIRNDQGQIPAVILRQQCAIKGKIEIETTPAPNCTKITVRVINETPMESADMSEQNAVIERTFASSHIVLSLDKGEFVSLLEPAEQFQDLAEECRNIGVWPVLVGDEKSSDRRTMLASPIILYDWPKIAAESAGPLFDGTEIDEILNLRILTMTDEEKREMRNVDAAARQFLERAENLSGEDFLKMHGTLRGVRPLEEEIFGTNQRREGVHIDGAYLKPGDRVRIRPKSRADIMDIALDGKVAIIEAVEEDAEARVHVALVVQDDPGKDLGLLRQPGHRFFYTVDEVEAVKEDV
ncbi:MAG: hypothetical protein ACXWIU_03065 [Limisphaerales bacterium]